MIPDSRLLGTTPPCIHNFHLNTKTFTILYANNREKNYSFSDVFISLTGQGEKRNGILSTGKRELRRIKRNSKSPNHFALSLTMFYSLIIRAKNVLSSFFSR